MNIPVTFSTLTLLIVTMASLGIVALLEKVIHLTEEDFEKMDGHEKQAVYNQLIQLNMDPVPRKRAEDELLAATDFELRRSEGLKLMMESDEHLKTG